MDVSRLPDDVARRPAVLRALAARLRAEDPWAPVVAPGTRRVRLIGMGSSAYAAASAAARARAAGADAVADLATLRRGWAPGGGTLVVAVSASGTSAETLAAGRDLAGRHLAALTGDVDGDLAALAGAGTVDLGAADRSGVASVSYTATLVLLWALADRLAGRPAAVAVIAERAADAADHLLDTAGEWLPRVAADLDGPDGLAVLAPAERLASARQSALMVREVPRRPATGCETGDWAHVDVYLTKTSDYRALLLAGSPWEAPALEWLRRRDAVVVPVGPVAAADGWPGLRPPARHPGDGDPDVAALVETTVAELVAARWWREAGEGSPVRTRRTR